MHPLVEAEVRPQLLIGEQEHGVFAALKAVEVRVRSLSGLKAFGQTGPLTNMSASKGEQAGTRVFFAGAYAVLRNPAGHRVVDYEDVSEGAEAWKTASLLMRMLDRVQDPSNRLVIDCRTRPPMRRY